MIYLIIGAKGSGKTKRIVDAANDMVSIAKGNIIYVDDKSDHMYSLKHEIRMINTAEYNVETEAGLWGFIRGLVASNGDTETIFIDGINRMANKNVAEMQDFFTKLQKLGSDNGVNFVLTISCDEALLPEFIQQLLNKGEAKKI